MFAGMFLFDYHVNMCNLLFVGLTLANLKELQKTCTGLQYFRVEYEQICKIELFTFLPKTITQLALRYCNLSVQNFMTLLSDGKGSYICGNLVEKVI